MLVSGDRFYILLWCVLYTLPEDCVNILHALHTICSRLQNSVMCCSRICDRKYKSTSHTTLHCIQPTRTPFGLSVLYTLLRGFLIKMFVVALGLAGFGGSWWELIHCLVTMHALLLLAFCWFLCILLQRQEKVPLTKEKQPTLGKLIRKTWVQRNLCWKILLQFHCLFLILGISYTGTFL